MAGNYEDKPGDIAVFPVKKRSDKGPAYTGFYILPDGTKHQVALWERRNGVLSGSRDVRAEENAHKAPQQHAPREQRPARRERELDDEIPF